jgi:DNA repair protein RadC
VSVSEGGVYSGVGDAPPSYRFRLRELPSEERPRERLLRLGPQALSTAELLAILLRTGSAREGVLELATRLLRERGGVRGLAAADVAELSDGHAVGPAKASTVGAAFELGRRLALEGAELRATVTSPHDIVRLLAPEMELLEQEELRLLALDAKHHVLAQSTLYRGTVSAAPGRVAELFREAVRRNAVAIALAHNHPSGDPAPSEEDVEFTRAVVEAGALLEIAVLDHLIFGRGRWVSLRDRGLGFEEPPGSD